MFGKIAIRPPQSLWFSEDEGRDLVILNCPNPPSWDVFYQRQKAYYLQKRRRYREVIGFWNPCSYTVRNASVRCRSYSSRVPSAYPDYLCLQLQPRR